MNEKTKVSAEEKEIFDYLNELRDSGATNMFGAVPYIEAAFDMPSATARKMLSKWMTNFNEEGYEVEDDK